MTRYGKRGDRIGHEEDPFDADTGLAALAENPVTATDAFYVRGDGAVPELDPIAWRLHVHPPVSGFTYAYSTVHALDVVSGTRDCH